MATTVGELSIVFGLQPDRASWRKGEALINSMRRTALGVAGIFGAGKLGSAMIGFNANVEDSKNQIAGMLALARRSDLNSQLEDSNKLYEGLRQKAAELPGETQDYVQMLGMLTEPMARAGASLEQMQDLTVNTFVAAKGLGEGWQKASRDVGEFINFGKANQVDTFLRRILGSAGYEFDEATKKRLKAMSREQRLAIAMNAMSSKAIKDLGERQANSFTGRMDKLKEQTKQFLGRVGLPLFKALGEAIQSANAWLKAHSKEVQEVADKIGGALVGAFKAAGTAINWLIDHKDIVIAALKGIASAFFLMGVRAAWAWMMTLGPLGKIIGLATTGWYLFGKLRDALGDVGAAMTAAFGMLAVGMIWRWIGAVRAAAAASGMVQMGLPGIGAAKGGGLRGLLGLGAARAAGGGAAGVGRFAAVAGRFANVLGVVTRALPMLGYAALALGAAGLIYSAVSGPSAAEKEAARMAEERRQLDPIGGAKGLLPGSSGWDAALMKEGLRLAGGAVNTTTNITINAPDMTADELKSLIKDLPKEQQEDALRMAQRQLQGNKENK